MNQGIDGTPPTYRAPRDARTIAGVDPPTNVANHGTVYNQLRRIERPATQVDTHKPLISVG